MSPTNDPMSTRGNWRLAIDLGTTYTSATVAGGDTTELLMIGGESRMPSTVAVDDDGSLVAGVGAERVLVRSPERAERNPKRRIGDEFIVLGGQAVRTVDALAAVLRVVADEARTRFGGTEPAALILTHPARWGAIRLGKLVEAAALAGLPEPLLVAEPIAAAWAASATAGIAVGETAAIYDLGGGTLDIAIVRRTDDGFDVVGPPGGSDRIGGEGFDERLYQYLGESLATHDPDAWEQLRFSTERQWRRASHDFRAQVRSAKEALSSRPDDALYLGAPIDRELRLTRDELGMVLEPDIAASVTELADTVTRAGLQPADLDHVFLVGGGSRVPQVAQRIGEWRGAVPTTWGDPKSVVAIGAHAAAGDGRRLDAVAPTGAVAVTAATAEPLIVTMSDEPGVDLNEPAERAEPAAPAPTAPPAARSRRRGPLVLAAVAVAVLAGGAIAWAAASGGDDGVDASSTVTTAPTSAPATTVADADVQARLDAITDALDLAERDLAPTAADRAALSELRGRVAAFGAGAPTEQDVATLEQDVAAFVDDLTLRASAASTTPASTTPGTTTTSTTSTTTSTTSTLPGAIAPTTTRPGAATPTTRPAATNTTVAAPTTTVAPVVVTPAPTTTVAPTTTSNLRQVPNVVGQDFSIGADAIQGAGFGFSKVTTTCTGGQPSSQIVGQNPTGMQVPGTTITLTVCI